MLKKPYIVSVEPKEPHSTIDQSQNLTFTINAYDTGLNYTWFVNGEQQSTSGNEFSDTFLPTRQYTIKVIVANNANDTKTITWTVNETSPIHSINKLSSKPTGVKINRRGTSSIQIGITTPHTGEAVLSIRDCAGRLVMSSSLGVLSERATSVDCHIPVAANRIHFYSVEVDGKVIGTRKLISLY